MYKSEAVCENLTVVFRMKIVERYVVISNRKRISGVQTRQQNRAHDTYNILTPDYTRYYYNRQLQYNIINHRVSRFVCSGFAACVFNI